MSPLLVVQRAEDFDQALKLCNGVRHGLMAALFSNSADLQGKFLMEAQAGMLKINSATAGVDVSLPFGGWKMSGWAHRNTARATGSFIHECRRFMARKNHGRVKSGMQPAQIPFPDASRKAPRATPGGLPSARPARNGLMRNLTSVQI